ncbi:MAG: DUF5651 domain-containing protein [Clostridium sp.]|uniref:DUF5651 domain-containing protein n=1 Tax=Clostridium sp. TaxID=1506 RepID=UPI00305908E6
MSNFRREYLNAEEKNIYMISKAFIQMLNGERNLQNKITNEIWQEWEKRGMITSSMKKNIKMVKTYLNKFCYEIEENLNETENKKLKKQLEKFDYKLIDDYTVSKLMRDVNNNIKYAVIERDKLNEVLEDIAEVRCVACTIDYRECAIFKMLDDISTPYCGEEPNCPYAANLEKLSTKEKEHIDKFKKRLHKQNKFRK